MFRRDPPAWGRTGGAAAASHVTFPSVDALHEHLNTITQTTDNDLRRQLESTLLASLQHASTASLLLQLIQQLNVSAPVHVGVRQLAAVMLRKRIITLHRSLGSQPQAQRDLRSTLLSMLGTESERLIRLALCHIVCVLTKSIGIGAWPEVAQSILSAARSDHPAHQRLSMLLIYNLADIVLVDAQQKQNDDDGDSPEWGFIKAACLAVAHVMSDDTSWQRLAEALQSPEGYAASGGAAVVGFQSSSGASAAGDSAMMSVLRVKLSSFKANAALLPVLAAYDGASKVRRPLCLGLAQATTAGMERLFQLYQRCRQVEASSTRSGAACGGAAAAHSACAVAARNMMIECVDALEAVTELRGKSFVELAQEAMHFLAASVVAQVCFPLRVREHAAQVLTTAVSDRPKMAAKQPAALSMLVHLALSLMSEEPSISLEVNYDEDDDADDEDDRTTERDGRGPSSVASEDASIREIDDANPGEDADDADEFLEERRSPCLIGGVLLRALSQRVPSKHVMPLVMQFIHQTAAATLQNGHLVALDAASISTMKTTAMGAVPPWAATFVIVNGEGTSADASVPLFLSVLRLKAAAVALACCAEGASGYLRKQCAALLQFVASMCIVPNGGVRYAASVVSPPTEPSQGEDASYVLRDAAAFALTYFGQHLQPEINTHHESLMPLLISLLDETRGDILLRTTTVLDSLCEQLDTDLEGYVPPLMSKLLALLPHVAIPVQKNLCSVVGAMSLTKVPSVISMIPTLLTIFQAPLQAPLPPVGTSTAQRRRQLMELHAQVIETAGLLAVAACVKPNTAEGAAEAAAGNDNASFMDDAGDGAAGHSTSESVFSGRLPPVDTRPFDPFLSFFWERCIQALNVAGTDAAATVASTSGSSTSGGGSSMALLKEQCFGFAANLVKIYRENMADCLPALVDCVIASLSTEHVLGQQLHPVSKAMRLAEEAAEGDGSGGDSEDSDDDGDELMMGKVRAADVEEKACACYLVGELSVYAPAALSRLGAVNRLQSELLRCIDNSHDVIKENAIVALGKVVMSAMAAVYGGSVAGGTAKMYDPRKGQPVTHDLLPPTVRPGVDALIVQVCLPTMTSSREKRVVAAACDAIVDLCNHLGATAVHPFVDDIVGVVSLLLRKQTPCQSLGEEEEDDDDDDQEAADTAGEIPDRHERGGRDDDDDEDHDKILIDSVSEICDTLAECYGSCFLPYFAVWYPDLLKYGDASRRSDEDVVMATGVVAKALMAFTGLQHHFGTPSQDAGNIQRLYGSAADLAFNVIEHCEDTTAVSNGCYLLRALTENLTPWLLAANHVGRYLDRLSAVISASKGEAPVSVDNAVSACASLLRCCPASALPPLDRLLPTLCRLVPMRVDRSENANVAVTLAHLATHRQGELCGNGSLGVGGINEPPGPSLLLPFLEACAKMLTSTTVAAVVKRQIATVLQQQATIQPTFRISVLETLSQMSPRLAAPFRRLLPSG